MRSRSVGPRTKPWRSVVGTRSLASGDRSRPRLPPTPRQLPPARWGKHLPLPPPLHIFPEPSTRPRENTIVTPMSSIFKRFLGTKNKVGEDKYTVGAGVIENFMYGWVWRQTRGIILFYVLFFFFVLLHHQKTYNFAKRLARFDLNGV